jgi:hypothetical protein
MQNIILHATTMILRGRGEGYLVQGVVWMVVWLVVGVSKKTEKPRKPEKNLKKPNREKKWIKPIRILKKPTSGSVSVL